MRLRNSAASASLVTVVLALATVAPCARAVDVDAGDFEAAPAGFTSGLVYLQYAERSTAYSDGKKVLKDAQLRSNVVLFRGAYFFDIAGVRASVNACVPVGSLSASNNLSALGATTAVGDPILSAGIWPINNPQARRFLAIAGYVFTPYGQYDADKALNMGRNRWGGALQAGFVQGFAQNWSAELVADAAFYGENGKFGTAGAKLKQGPQYQFQGFLNYLPTQATRVAVGVSELTGGKTIIDGVDQEDAASTLKANVTFAAFVGPTSQLQVTVGRDLAVKNGLAEDFRLNLRFMQIF